MTYEYLGCFKDKIGYPRPLPVMIVNLRKEPGFDWSNLNMAIQICAEKAMEQKSVLLTFCPFLGTFICVMYCYSPHKKVMLSMLPSVLLTFFVRLTSILLGTPICITHDNNRHTINKLR